MYVCVCNGVTEAMIEDAANSGARNLQQLQVMTGTASGCGSCADAAEAVLKSARANSRVSWLSVEIPVYGLPA